MTPTERRTRVAVAQMRTGPDVAANLQSIADLTAEAADAKAELVAFPEYATYLGDNSKFADHAQPIATGATVGTVRELARQHSVSILLGSTVEEGEDGRTYNTSVLVDSAGEIVSTYRKIHLFTSIIPGASGSESTWISPGTDVVVTPWNEWNLGMSVCFDVRFPELYRELTALDANVLLIPAAFVAHMGKDHWEVLLRARAIENQSYVLAPAQIGPYEGGGETYGRSMIVDPWGTVLAVVGDGEGTGIAVADLTIDRVAQVRTRLPALANRRFGRTSLGSASSTEPVGSTHH